MFRLNTSHGTEEGHAANIEIIRKISQETGKYIPILIDLQGPKIRVGNIANPIEIHFRYPSLFNNSLMLIFSLLINRFLSRVIHIAARFHLEL